MRRLQNEDEHYAPNVWPAITDTVLLMASIFIVLSVVSMASMAKKLHDYKEPKSGDSQVACRVVQIPGDSLFDKGQSEFRSAAARSEIKSVLLDLPEHIESIRSYAESQGWKDYYVIVEAGGHADDDPYLDEGGRDKNWALSSSRAISVVLLMQQVLKSDASLRKKLGVALGEAPPGSTVLRAAGYSYHLPLKSYSSTKGSARVAVRSENRRVEIRLFAQPVGMVHLKKP